MAHVLPDDRLRELVHPSGWAVPGRDRYDLVVIGGGTAGLVSAVGAAGLGAQVALVERHRLGGDCLNVGCVPSKAVVRSARAVSEIRAAARLGVLAGTPRIDFSAVMQRMREVRASLARHDSAERLASLGIDVYFGQARFDSADRIRVGARALGFRRAVIAAGSRPAIPPIPGLDRVSFLTNETIFDLERLPPRLLVIGAGPIGCELAQAFALLGSEVTLIDAADRVLPREDPDASALLQQRLEDDGVRVLVARTLARIERLASGVCAHVEGDVALIEVDEVLVAVGRTPAISSLGLEAAGIRADASGVCVDDRLRTSNRRVYACGDIASPWKFTHAADATARIVVQNALFLGRRRVSQLVVPWCTFTYPEVAHVGVDARTAAATGLDTATVLLADIDRAALDGDVDGFVRVHHSAGRIRGCTCVGPSAGELISTAAEAMRAGRRLPDLAAAVLPYPTYSEALRKIGDAYQRTRLTPLVRRAFSTFLSARRQMS